MKTTNFILSILFVFAISALFGQGGAISVPKINEEVNSTTFSWKPFTIEINSSNLGHGFAFEKGLTKKLFLSTSVSSDFKGNDYYPIGYKLGFGALYNLIEYDRISLRTGLNLGARKISFDHDNVWEMSGIIFCGVGPIEPVTAAYAEVPISIQIKFLRNFSLDLGVSSLFQKQVEFEQIMSGLEYGSTIPNKEFAYHVGLRYTFVD